MKARSKPLAKIAVSELGIDITPRLKPIKYEDPAGRKGGVKLASAGELAEKIKAVLG